MKVFIHYVGCDPNNYNIVENVFNIMHNQMLKTITLVKTDGTCIDLSSEEVWLSVNAELEED